MRHQVDGRKFGRNTSHRVAMLRNMANCVIEKEQIITTVQKAKEVRRVVDRLITLGKSGTLASRRLAFDRTRNHVVVSRLFAPLAERYQSRQGGYTRVLKIAERRWGDAAEMAVLELVDHPPLDRKKKVSAEAHDHAHGDHDHNHDHAHGSHAPKDPFSRFRKLFNPKTKVKGGGPGGSGGVAKGGGAGRKTPAASNSNKSGSS